MTQREAPSERSQRQFRRQRARTVERNGDAGRFEERATGGPMAVETEAAEPPRIGFFVQVAHYLDIVGPFFTFDSLSGKESIFC